MIDIDKCCLTRFPQPVLTAPAKAIDEINDNVRELADKMIEIMIASKGVGLAGPQAGLGLRIFVVSPDGTRENARVYINPEISVSGTLEANEEGCLSLPGVFAKIKRHKQCTVTATDLDGNRFTQEGDGLLIRAFQHEYDHIEGILIKDRMGQVQRLAARKQFKKLQKDLEQNEH